MKGNKNSGHDKVLPGYMMIPSGSFQMGIGNKISHPVYIEVEEPFFIGKYPVTQKEWMAVMGENPSRFIGDKRPVEQVSWAMVQAFIRRKNLESENAIFRLPSEAEWEYACRAGTQTKYYFGEYPWSLGEYAWFSGCSAAEIRNLGENERKKMCTHAVGQKEPNPWGLYDMHGNVYEWTQDLWHMGLPNSTEPWEEGRGVTSMTVVRGGSYLDPVTCCTSSYRRALDRSQKYPYVGFRLVVEPID